MNISKADYYTSTKPVIKNEVVHTDQWLVTYFLNFGLGF